MATWKSVKADMETTLKIETINETTRVTVASVNDAGTMFAWDSIAIPLKTLKEMVNAQ